VMGGHNLLAFVPRADWEELDRPLKREDRVY